MVDAGALWSGGVATAVVAGLVALAGILVCRWLFGIPILAPKQDGAYGNVHTTEYVLAAAAAALLATLIAHLLLLSTPAAMTFFAWIVGVATVAVVLYPFSTSAPLAEKAATAAVSVVIGFAIGSLITGVAGRAVRRRPVRRDYETLTPSGRAGPVYGRGTGYDRGTEYDRRYGR